MSGELSLDFSPPRQGWLQLSLRSGDQHLVIPVSHIPFDSLGELASAVAAFLEAGRQGVAHINCEPEEYDLMFESGTLPATLQVKGVHYPRGRRAGDSEVVLLHEGDTIQTGRTIWWAFRKLESQFLPEHWTHPFPSKIVGGLERLTAE